MPRPESTRSERGPLARAAGVAVLWRAVGLGSAKAITLARTLALAWLLVPEDFGLFALATVPLDLMLGVTELGMIQALARKQGADARDYNAAWTVGLIRSVLVSSVLIALAPLLGSALGDARASPLIRLVALRPIIAAMTSIRVAHLERELDFRSLALIDIAGAIATAVIAIAFARSLGVWALVFGALCGTAAGVLVSYAFAPHAPRLIFDRIRTRELMSFGRWVLAGSLTTMIGEGILMATMSRLLGASAVGRYSLAANLALTPAAAIGSLIGGVAFSVHVRIAHDEEQRQRVFRSTLLAMLVLSMPIYAVLIALAPRIVAHLLDARWAGTAGAIQLLALSGILGLFFDLASSVFAGTGRPHLLTALCVVFSLTILLTVWPLTRAVGLDGAAISRIAADFAVAVTFAALLPSVVRKPSRGLTMPFIAVTLASIAGAIVAFAAVRINDSARVLGVASVTGLCVAASLLWALDRIFGLGLSRDSALVLPIGRA